MLLTTEDKSILAWKNTYSFLKDIILTISKG